LYTLSSDKFIILAFWSGTGLRTHQFQAQLANYIYIQLCKSA